MRILQINTRDSKGGAANVARDLHRSFLAQGHDAWLAVGSKFGNDPRTIALPNWAARPRLGRSLQRLSQELAQRPWARGLNLDGALNALARPNRYWNYYRGYEDFAQPGVWQFMQELPGKPDIIHCHNLHGDYFDLRALPWLSRMAPLIITLHDAWLLSGHCSHSFGCRRWQSGCGECPDLTIYPAVRRDATRTNWQRKKKIAAQSSLYLASPAQWLLDDLEHSLLQPAIVQKRLIPHGIDLTVFKAGERGTARKQLGLPRNAHVLLFAADKPQRNRFKDFETVRRAAALTAANLPDQEVIFLAIGAQEGELEEMLPGGRVVPFTEDPARMACYYQAADLYLHAAHMDTFPVTILEALACGTPVVATAVGGIPEQVQGWQGALPLGLDDRQEAETARLNPYDTAEATGVLVAHGAAEALAAASTKLLMDSELRRQLGENAARCARERYDLRRTSTDYLDWFEELAAIR